MKDKELQLQRLVDGQLNRQQIQDVLQYAQDQPELWRDITAAFVEEQIWRNEIQACSNDEPLVSLPANNSTSNETNHIDSRPNQNNGFSGTKFWLSLAAATLLGLWLGNNWERYNNDPNSDPTNMIAKDDSVNIADQAPSIDGVQSEFNDSSTQLAENSQQMFRPVHHLSMGDAGDIPLYTLDEARKMGMTFDDSELPEDVVAKYEQQGYQLQQNTRYISGKTNDGRRVVVPVRSITLNPGN